MSKDREHIKAYRCPECLAKEIDMMLKYDKADQEYYCIKCCYTGVEEDILKFYKLLQEYKYPGIFKLHTWQK